MTINTRFNLGDTVYVLIHGQLIKTTITTISTSSYLYDDGTVSNSAMYNSRELKMAFRGDEVFSSPEEYEGLKKIANI